MHAEDVHDIAMRFQRSVYVRKNPNIASARRMQQEAMHIHMTNTTEYTRHLARLDRLDKSQLNTVRPRAWKRIAQANIKLSAMDALVRDFERTVRPKVDVVIKILAKLDALKTSIVVAGQDAVSLLVRELQLLEMPLRGSFSGVFLHVFEYLTTADIVLRCQLVSTTWKNAIAANQVVSRSMRSGRVRGRLWQHAIESHVARMAIRTSVAQTSRSSHQPAVWCYHTLLDRAIKDKHNRFHRTIIADVKRTTFVRAEHMYPRTPSLSGTGRLGAQVDMSSEDVETLHGLHTKLTHVLMAYCQLDPLVGYCHGMTFLGASLLTCLEYDDEATFQVFAAAMQHYAMADLFHLPDLPGTTQRMHQLHNLIRAHLPSVDKCLRSHRIHPHMFSSGWIMSLFLNEPSLSPCTIGILLDGFFQGGWPHMFRIYMGLLSIHADAHIITPHANRTLRALVQLPKHLEASLSAVLDEGRVQFSLATSDDALDIMAAQNGPTAGPDYF
ncbi:hypothetical protein, variant [Aphanomyces invadans]|nr:hypothetical protein, variant [Aphanomyces invadans]ETW02274.1 hypothetical protein, variant [Aphanomyces invadans]|eukprot:XP_008868879.1 hypothetical protein, variant [Aphanomyces invadans]